MIIVRLSFSDLEKASAIMFQEFTAGRRTKRQNACCQYHHDLSSGTLILSS